MRRKEGLATGQIYHIFNRSIAEFRIFNDAEEFERMTRLMYYYTVTNELKFSDFIEVGIVKLKGFENFFNLISKDKETLIQIVAYCLMPTHYHLILKQLVDGGITTYLRKFQNAYSHYFNTKHHRKGPLWESKFKNVPVEDDEQLIHLTRYLHLNPVSASLVKKPEEWQYSSYNEYLDKINGPNTICHFENILEIVPSIYRKFVNEQIAYQKELAKIKKLIID